MTIDEFGFWTHAREMSYASGVFYFDGRKIAARFAATGKDRPYRIARRLVQKGWFVVTLPCKRLKNGKFSETHYRILSHQEWVSKHGSEYCFCPDFAVVTSPQIATGKPAASPQIANNQSSNCERPVAKQGHNLKGFNRRENKNENKVRSQISRPSGQDKDFLASLAIISNDPKAAFDARQSKQVIALRDDYSPDEIKSAFKEIWDSADDDFAKKHFARTFADRAPQVIAAQRRRAEEIRKTEAIKAAAMAQGRAEVEAQLAEAEKRRQEEENFYDPLFDSPPVLESVSGK